MVNVWILPTCLRPNIDRNVTKSFEWDDTINKPGSLLYQTMQRLANVLSCASKLALSYQKQILWWIFGCLFRYKTKRVQADGK